MAEEKAAEEQNTDFPAMVYKHPGKEEIHGDNFDTLVVNDAEELKKATADGWCETTPKALEASKKAKK